MFYSFSFQQNILTLIYLFFLFYVCSYFTSWTILYKNNYLHVSCTNLGFFSRILHNSTAQNDLLKINHIVSFPDESVWSFVSKTTKKEILFSWRFGIIAWHIYGEILLPLSPLRIIIVKVTASFRFRWKVHLVHRLSIGLPGGTNSRASCSLPCV